MTDPNKKPESTKEVVEKEQPKEKTSKELLEEHLQKYSWLWEDNSPLDEYTQKQR